MQNSELQRINASSLIFQLIYIYIYTRIQSCYTLRVHSQSSLDNLSQLKRTAIICTGGAEDFEGEAIKFAEERVLLFSH